MKILPIGADSTEKTMSKIDLAELEKVAEACRRGFMSLTSAKGSTFTGFPEGACGVASEIVARIVSETLQCEGVYVCGTRHPQLEKGSSHAWFEIGDFIIDVTYDQFEGTGLSGWIFERSAGWHSQFSSLETTDGFMHPRKWGSYPSDGYRAALDEVKKAGLTCSQSQ